MAVVNHHFVAADAVQVDVHCAHAADLRRQLHSFDQLFLQRSFFIGVEVLLVAIENILIGVAE